MPAPLISMTGFASRRGTDGRARWGVDVRSLNGKGLEMRLRLPSGCEAMEAPIREQIGQRISRGSINLSLSLERAGGARLGIDRALLADILALHKDLMAEGQPLQPSLDGLLGIRGVLVESEQSDLAPEVHAAVLQTVTDALEDLMAHRAAEGARLAAIITGHLAQLSALVAQAAAHADAQPEGLRARLRAQLAALLEAVGDGSIDASRLEQELAYQVTRADVREELDRLTVHLAAVAEAVAGGSPVGKRLEFLCQELNREANTLCSKSASASLTAIGVELKLGIDRLREQVANVE